MASIDKPKVGVEMTATVSLPDGVDDETIRAIMLDQRSPEEIAKSYGVDSALIHRIKKGTVWKHITNPSYAAFLSKGVSGA